MFHAGQKGETRDGGGAGTEKLFTQLQDTVPST